MTVPNLIRSAVSSSAFEEAERLLEIYGDEMQAKWKAAVSPGQRAEIAAEVTEVLESARVATLAARSHAQRRLIHLASQRAYAPSGIRR